MHEWLLFGEDRMNEHGYKVGDLVYWAEDNDIGIIVSVEEGSALVKWSNEPTKSGWYPTHHWNLRRLEDERKNI